MKKNNSHLTAVSRQALSVPMRRLASAGLVDPLRHRVLDYGCGRGGDADRVGMDKYDPYYFPEEPQGPYDVVVCIYVLNVIPSPRRRREVLSNIRGLLAPGGRAYVTVRRRIKRGEGWTSRGTWQSGQIRIMGGRSLWRTSEYETYEVSEKTS